MTRAVALFFRGSDWVSKLCEWGLRYDIKDSDWYMSHCGVYCPNADVVYEFTFKGLVYRRMEHAQHDVVAAIDLPLEESDVHHYVLKLKLGGDKPVTNWTEWFLWRFRGDGIICTSLIEYLIDWYPPDNTPGAIYRGLLMKGFKDITNDIRCRENPMPAM